VGGNLIFKGKYDAKMEFLERQGEERVQIKIPSMGGVWLFSGTTHCHLHVTLQKCEWTLGDKYVLAFRLKS